MTNPFSKIIVNYKEKKIQILKRNQHVSAFHRSIYRKTVNKAHKSHRKETREKMDDIKVGDSSLGNFGKK